MITKNKILFKNYRKTQYLILITGTPALARPKELFSLIDIINNNIFQNFKQFGARYCDPKI